MNTDNKRFDELNGVLPFMRDSKGRLCIAELSRQTIPFATTVKLRNGLTGTIEAYSKHYHGADQYLVAYVDICNTMVEEWFPEHQIEVVTQ